MGAYAETATSSASGLPVKFYFLRSDLSFSLSATYAKINMIKKYANVNQASVRVIIGPATTKYNQM